MSKKISILLIAFSLVMILNYSCTSDPISIEVPTEDPNPDVGDSTALITVIESDICDGVLSFESDVFPLIVSGCAYSGCHDAITAEEGVRLNNYDNILKEVTPGSPDQSELYKVLVKNPNDDKFMPPMPAFGFTVEQIELIKKWIEEGANQTSCRNVCDSKDRSFGQDIFPLIQNQCVGCHQPTNSLGDINLEDYDHIVGFALNGTLLGCVNHLTGYSAMPKTSNKMTDCQIAKINNWIVDGAPNN